jgi:two-component system phosphate regulon response regulator PhoB
MPDMKQKRVLIVEDEEDIRELLRFALEMADFECFEANNIRDAHIQIVDHKPDMVLLDWMLPDGSGIELARRLKRNELTASVPIIMLTAREEESDKILGLESGADDYITKPFSPRELVARLKAVLRRTGESTGDLLLKVGDLVLDPAAQRASIGDRSITMGPTELRLLSFFMSHQERVYTRDQLLDHVWGGNVYIDERTVDVHIRRLRKALGKEYSGLVQTVRGTGYRFSSKLGDLG